MEILLNGKVTRGTLIIDELPFVCVLNSKIRIEYCDHCFLKKEVKRCSNCQYAYYCGRTCQREGWSVHKLECHQLKQVAPLVVPNAARLLARLIKKLQNKGDETKSYYAPNKYRKFKDLMSHYSDLKNDDVRMEHFTSLYGVLNNLFKDDFLPNPAELIGIFGRMCVNSFNICDAELNSIGTGIYLGASIFDHSCQPNAVATFEGTRLNIRVTETIEQFSWNKIFLSYIDTLQSVETRQKELLSTYYFLCQCPRCLDPEEIKVMSAAACPNLKCDANIEIISESSNNVLKCYKCETEITSQFKQQYEEVTEFTNIHLQNMKLAYLDVCRVCLKKHEGILHSLNIQHVKILDSAFESSIDFQQWDDAKIFGIKLIPGYRKYLGEFHPLLGLLYLKLSKILIYQENVVEGRLYLTKAFNILKVTHGENSVLFKNEIIPLIQENCVA